MTTPDSTALATRGWTDQQIKNRIKANVAARFGLENASGDQLNVIFLLARRWALDPVNELTLYEGRPFITLDGRLTLMRRNPDYRGYRCTPLTAALKEARGYEPDDLAVECTVITKEHGEITARGCVRAAEVKAARERSAQSGKRAAPIGIYAPEIAEKRAIARASRAAFGQDVPDEDDAGYVIAEVDPEVQRERIKELAARQEEIFGTEDQAYADQPAETPDAEE